MSIAAVAAALDLDVELDPGQALLLVALAEHYNPSTGRCWPALDVLCRRGRQSRRTAQKNLRILEELKLIRAVAHYEKSGRQLANSYFLTYLNRSPADMVKLEPEIVALQGIDGGEGADSAPSLFDALEAPGEGATGDAGRVQDMRPGVQLAAPPNLLEPEAGTVRKPEESHPNPPDGRAKIFFDPSKRKPELEAVCVALAGVPFVDDAGELHKRAAAHLTQRGYTVETEIPVADRGDGRRGRIDVVARRGPATFAIELDRTEMRAKSLVKLACVGELAGKGLGYRIGVVRASAASTCPAGLDAFVVLEGPKPAPAAIWIEADTAAWRIACEELGHKPTLHSPSSAHGGRRGWLFRAAAFKPETLARLA